VLERDVLQQRVLNAPSTVSLRCGRYIDEDRPCSHEDGNPITERQGHRHLVRAAAGVTARDRGCEHDRGGYCYFPHAVPSMAFGWRDPVSCCVLGIYKLGNRTYPAQLHGLPSSRVT